MEAWHPLRALLHAHLVTDAQAATSLHLILAALNADSLATSPHQQKWIARVNSLLYSKDIGGRWAGLCIATRTAELSETLMVESAHGWVGVALPMIMKNEPTPILKAAVRLLRFIFSAATEIPEFQRQVATPNVPKFSQALLQLVEKDVNRELTVMAINSLTRVLPLYPTLHRALHPQLSTICLQLLDGSPVVPLSSETIDSASRLYAILHHTGGKVAAATLWRKAVDDTIMFAMAAFRSLRTSVNDDLPLQAGQQLAQASIASFNLSLDRLRCGTAALCKLLKTTNTRPAQVPIGSLVDFSIALLGCTLDDHRSDIYDASIQAMELSAIPLIWQFACSVINSTAECVGSHLVPHTSRLISYITYHLGQRLPTPQRLAFFQTIHVVLTYCPHFHDGVMLGRLVKAVLPSCTSVLATKDDGPYQEGVVPTFKGRKGKKRTRGYEGDEVFKLGKAVLCATPGDGSVIIAAVDVLGLLLDNPHLTSAIHSLTTRVLLSILLGLSQISSAALSVDLSLHDTLHRRVQDICRHQTSGTLGTMGRTLGLVIRAGIKPDTRFTRVEDPLELLLHPRLPPLLRPLPHVKGLALYRVEEGEEESDLRKYIGLGSPAPSPDEAMANVPPTPTSPPRAASATLGTGEHRADRPLAPPTIHVVSELPSSSVATTTTGSVPPFPPPPQATLPSDVAFVVNSELADRRIHAASPSPVPKNPSDGSKSASTERERFAPFVRKASSPGLATVEVDRGDEDEMPSIDMESDSDA